MTAPALERSSPRTSFDKAVRWNLLGSTARQGVTLSATFALVVLLQPSDFGTASVALAVVLLWQTAIQQGFLPVLVARERLSHVELTTAHWFLLACGSVAAVLTFVGAGPAADATGSPALGSALRALAFFLVLESLAVPHEAVVRRAMDGRALALRGLLAPAFGAGTGVVAALLGAGVWALVGQQLVISATNLVVLVVRSGWRPRGSLRWRVLQLFGPLAWRSSLGGLGQALNARTDLLVVGLLLGPIPAGLYRLAGRLVDAAHDVTCRAVVAVSLAELGRTSEAELARRARTILERTMVVSAPSLGVLAGSGSALTALLGEDWVGAAPALSLLCVSSMLTSLASTLVPLLQRRERLGLVTSLAWGGAVCGLLLFIGLSMVVAGAATSTSLAVIAAGRVLLQTGETAVALKVVHRDLGAGVSTLFSARVGYYAIVSVVCASASWGISVVATGSAVGNAVTAVVTVASGICVAVLALLVDPDVRHPACRAVLAVAARRHTAPSERAERTA